MTVIWSVAKQMIAESLRMKIALVFLVLLGLVLLGLPFAIEGDSSLTGAVQAFLSYSLSATAVLLSILTIFMSKSLSDELVNRQLFLVLTKPVPRWQFLLGKWLGMVLFNAVFLTFTGLIVFGMVHYIKATHPPQYEGDAAELENQVLVARHARPYELPWDTFAKLARDEFEQKREQGAYDNIDPFDPEEELRKLRVKYEWQWWRIIPPREFRVLEFSNILVDRSPGNEIQFRYKTEVKQFPLDEIWRGSFLFGDREKDSNEYVRNVRHYVGRYHTITVPADAVAPDGTLRVVLHNRNPFSPPEPDFNYLFEFPASEKAEVYFIIGTFAGNLFRLLVLMLSKLMLLAAVALLCTTVFSFPVACLVSFSFYLLAGTRRFVLEALDFASVERAGWFASISEFFLHLVIWVYDWMKIVVPDFGYYDGVETLVNGKNVGLTWLMLGVGELALLRTFVVLGLAILLFQRREIAEVSV